MKLSKIGELGFPTSKEELASFDTVEKIENQINKISTAQLDPAYRERKDQMVVTAESYIVYLKDKLARLKQHQQAIAQKKQDQSQQPKTVVGMRRVEGENIELRAEIAKRDEIIADLLAIAKAKRLEEASAPVFYTGQIEESASDVTVESIDAVRDLVNTIVGDDADEDVVTQFGNIVLLRGILGEKRAKVIVADLYGVDAYDGFIKQLEGED